MSLPDPRRLRAGADGAALNTEANAAVHHHAAAPFGQTHAQSRPLHYDTHNILFGAAWTAVPAMRDWRHIGGDARAAAMEPLSRSVKLLKGTKNDLPAGWPPPHALGPK